MVKRYFKILLMFYVLLFLLRWVPYVFKVIAAGEKVNWNDLAWSNFLTLGINEGEGFGYTQKGAATGYGLVLFGLPLLFTWLIKKRKFKIQ